MVTRLCLQIAVALLVGTVVENARLAGLRWALQIAEGSPSQLMVVEVFFEKDNVRFEIPPMYTPYGGGIFEGKIDSRGIKGSLKFKGVAGEQETLIRGRSYWDRLPFLLE